MINLNGNIHFQERNILKFRSDRMKLFLLSCLITILVVVIAYILTLCNSYNFLSYELGIILGGFTAILGYSLKD